MYKISFRNEGDNNKTSKDGNITADSDEEENTSKGKDSNISGDDSNDSSCDKGYTICVHL